MRLLIKALMAPSIVLLLAACSGQSDAVDDQRSEAIVENSTLEPDQTSEPEAGDLSTGSSADSIDDSLANDDQADIDQFDIAEFFFTEVDRQWFCSVTTAVSVFTDQLYLARTGEGTFERFGLVQWRRNAALDRIDIVAGVDNRFSLQEIFASNTVLEFQRVGSASADQGESQSEARELYECVLTTRDLSIL